MENEREDQEMTAEEQATAAMERELFLFPDMEESPSRAQVELWKQEHGIMLANELGPGEWVLFHPLTRALWLEIKTHLAERAAAGEQLSEEQVAEATVDQCVVWLSRSASSALQHKAGTLETLNEVIRLHSNFVNPVAVAQQTLKL